MVFFDNFAKNCHSMPHFNISPQPTKNGNIRKFIANSFLVQAESYEFTSIDEAKPSPLAQELFYLPFVKTVYIAQNFVAIEKYDIVSWEDVETEVAKSIEDYLNSGRDILEKSVGPKKVPISVYAESTPNPEAMKFVANKPLANGHFEFKSPEDTAISPLAKELFQFPFVKEVFISSNYVSILKSPMVEWNEIVMDVREFLRVYFESGFPILSDAALSDTTNTSNQSTGNTALTDIEQEIVSILNEYVAPAVAGDGGYIAFDSFNESSKTVRVILQGACSGCPSSTVTLKNGIETMLREMMKGKVDYVEAVNG